MDKEDIESVIKLMTKDLKHLKTRKRRLDAGAKRIVYTNNLPVKYKSYINSANKRGIEFKLSVEEFENICGMNCVYCGSDSKIGVDRIDSSDGYKLDNTQPCCTMCNLMKYRHSNEKFISHIKKIIRHLGLDNT